MKTMLTFGLAKFAVFGDSGFSCPTASVFLFDKSRVVFQDSNGRRVRTVRKFRDETHYSKFFRGEVVR